MDLTWNHGTVDNINTSIRRNYDKQLARILAEKTQRFARKCRGNFSYKCFIICPVVTVHLFRSRRRIRFSQIPERKIWFPESCFMCYFLRTFTSIHLIVSFSRRSRPGNRNRNRDRRNKMNLDIFKAWRGAPFYVSLSLRKISANLSSNTP